MNYISKQYFPGIIKFKFVFVFFYCMKFELISFILFIYNDGRNTKNYFPF